MILQAMWLLEKNPFVLMCGLGVANVAKVLGLVVCIDSVWV